jgi:hypothetical protein
MKPYIKKIKIEIFHYGIQVTICVCVRVCVCLHCKGPKHHKGKKKIKNLVGVGSIFIQFIFCFMLVSLLLNSSVVDL